jgi:hypothetical protein
MRTLRKTVAAALIALVVVGGGAVAAAQSAPETGPTPPEPAGEGRHHPLRARAVHGDLIVRTKDGFADVTLDRGRLTAIDGNRLTITRPDGPVVVVEVVESTRFRGVTSANELRVGRPVRVVHADGVAKVVVQRPADPADGNR